MTFHAPCPVWRKGEGIESELLVSAASYHLGSGDWPWCHMTSHSLRWGAAASDSDHWGATHLKHFVLIWLKYGPVFLSLISKSTFFKFLKVFNLYFTMWTTTPVSYRRSTVRPGVHEDYVQTFILLRIWIFNWIGSRLELPRTFLSLLTHYSPLISDLKFDKSLIWCNSYVTSERCSLLPEKKKKKPIQSGCTAPLYLHELLSGVCLPRVDWWRLRFSTKQEWSEVKTTDGVENTH